MVGARHPVPNNLPPALARMIGRDDVVQQITSALESKRLISIVGSGGMGKTTVGVAAANVVADSYADGAVIVDLAASTDAAFLAGAIAAALDIELAGELLLESLATQLHDRKVLIVLDTCERMILQAAEVASRLLRAGDGVRIIATSREPLRVSGEWVLRLAPLHVPDTDAALTFEALTDYSGVQLFVELSSTRSMVLKTATDIPLIVEICQRLEGLPLAIELAAAHVSTMGVRALCAHLRRHGQLLPIGRRTSEARHQNLRATLDWSYSVLSNEERYALDTLSVFRGRFTADDAVALLLLANEDRDSCLELLFSLVAKSLVHVDHTARPVLYRLLDMTRSYAEEKLQALAGVGNVRRRHAEVYLSHTQAAHADVRSPRQRWVQIYGGMIDDVRAAIDWGLGPDGDVLLASRLTSGNGALGQRVFQGTEYRGRVEAALAAMSRAGIADRELEMRLNIDLADALYQTEGITSRFVSTVLATRNDGQPNDGIDADNVTVNWFLAINLRDFTGALAHAARVKAFAKDRGEPEYDLGADRIMAQSLHYAGRHGEARVMAQSVLDSPVLNITHALLDKTVSMRIILSRVAWLENEPDLASVIAQQAILIAEAQSPASFCQCATFSKIPVHFWRGERKEAMHCIDRLAEVSRKHALPYWSSWARHFRTVAWHLDNPMEEEVFVGSETDAQPDPFQLDLMISIDPTLVTAEKAAEVVSKRTLCWNSPEVLRAWGEKLIVLGKPKAEVRSLFSDAVDLAQSQGALAWKHRAASSLASIS